VTLRVATRGSRLAVAQSSLVAQRIAAAMGEPFELVAVRTVGDNSKEPLDRIGGTGVFVGAVREAVLRGEADICVHSLKDLPTAPHPELVLGAVCARDRANDVLVARDGLKLADLPSGARIGTGSPRRAAQLARLRDDLAVVGIRGNIDTRLRAVAEGRVDAVVLAAAGLDRLGIGQQATEEFAISEVLPAPAQGALAVEMRIDATDANLVTGVKRADHGDTRVAVTAERSAMAALETGCTAPFGAFAVVSDDDVLELVATVLDTTGREPIRKVGVGAPAEAAAVGEDVAAALLAAGAGHYLGVG